MIRGRRELFIVFTAIVVLLALSTFSEFREDVNEENQDRTADPRPIQSQPIVWSSCGDGLECGIVEVPADYRDPGSGRIKIAVNVRRASSLEDRIGYLLTNPGGPGGSGVEFVEGSESSFTDEIASRFDIVGFDPRGVGGSEPSFACGDPGEWRALMNSIEGEADTQEETAAAEAAVNLCVETMGPVGGLLHSEYVARDMDEIRKVLGEDRISYLGFSYGSVLGVWYATLFPESVRAMVVDGADNPVDKADTQEERVNEAMEEIAPLEDGLERALGACDDTECPIYNDGDPIGYYMRSAEKLHLVNSASGDVPYAGFFGVITPLYSEEAWPLLWDGLYSLEEYDAPYILLNMALLQMEDVPTERDFTGHVNCLDSFVLKPNLDRATRLEDVAVMDVVVEEEYPLIAATGPWGAAVCPFYDQFAPEPFEGPLDGGGVPIMVVGNRSDPVTPFSESEEFVLETLSNGRLVETYHPEHVVYPDNDCVNEHIHRALIDRVYPDERIFCEREE